MNKRYTIDLIKGIVERGEQMKIVIDKRMEDLIEMCKRMESINHGNLIQVTDSVAKIHENVKQKLSRCKTTLKRLRLAEMVSAANEGSLPSTEIKGEVEIERMVFVTRRRGAEVSILNDQYGHVQPQNKDVFGNMLTHPLTGNFLLKKELERNQESLDEKFKMMAEESKTFEFPIAYCSIEQCPEGMLMATSSEVALVSQSGKVNIVLKLDESICCATYLKGHGVFFSRLCNIHLVKSNGEVAEFVLTGYPQCMAMSLDNQLLVCNYDGHYLMVSQYDVLSGQVQQKYQYEEYGKQISVNKQSGDVAVVCDFEMILVFDKTLKPKFWYCGLMDSSPRKPDRLTQNRMNGLFKPQDVCFDSFGHILIADKITMSILALNSDGKLMKVVVQFKSVPIAVATDDQDQLWAVLDDKTVKGIKYLQCDVHNNN